MKFIEKIKKNYMAISIICLLLATYVILFPMISDFLGKIDIRLTQCPFLRITGKECPLCGGTRYFRNITTAFYDVTYLFKPFGVIFLCVISEIIFRIIGIRKVKKNKDLNCIVKVDLIIHIIEILIFFIYEFTYIYQIY